MDQLERRRGKAFSAELHRFISYSAPPGAGVTSLLPSGSEVDGIGVSRSNPREATQSTEQTVLVSPLTRQG